MRMNRVGLATLAASVFAFAACGDPASPNGLIDDSAITRDVAASSGDAAAQMIETMIGNENSVAGGAQFAIVGPEANRNVEISRTHSCYDANGGAVNQCQPFSSVRMIVVAASVDGSSEGTSTRNGTVTEWTVDVHRTGADTIRRTFNGSTEASRSHVGSGTAKDTVTSTEGTLMRLVALNAVDSVKNIVFNLPRTSNPYPASGSFVRRAAVHAEVSKDGQSASRDITVRAEVVFPADNQGNVTLNVNAISCQLNLVTRAVTNCQ